MSIVKIMLKETKTRDQISNKWIDILLLKLFNLANSRYRFSLLIATSLFSLLSMMTIGIYKGVDLAQHTQFSSTFYNSILSGDFYPSWASGENFGYGSVGVRFYPPVTPFLFALARILVGDWYYATLIIFLLFTLTGGLGVYFLAKEYLSDPESIWAGMIFILMPYHLYEIQNNSQLAEFAGCSIIPFSLLFISRTCRHGRWVDVLGLAISYSVLILTHLPTTVIGSISLAIFGIISLPPKKVISTLTKLSLAVVLGLTASSIYWMRMLTELDWLRNTKFQTDNFFDYAHNFLLTAPWFDIKQLWFINSLYLTLALFSTGIIFGLILKNKNDTAKNLHPLICLLILALGMCLVLSKPLWLIIPFLTEVQFPWRWLTIVSVCLPILSVASFKGLLNLSQTSKFWDNTLKSFGIILFLCFLTLYLLMFIEFRLNHIPSQEYDSWVTEKSKSLGSEWFWTTDAKEEAFSIKEKVLVENRQTTIIKWNPTERIFMVEGGDSSQLRVATLFYPHWKATINNHPVELQTADDGAIIIPLTAESITVRLWFEEPWYIKAAQYISLFSWIGFILTLILYKFFSLAKRRN
jgi:hypothetical protein